MRFIVAHRMSQEVQPTQPTRSSGLNLPTWDTPSRMVQHLAHPEYSQASQSKAALAQAKLSRVIPKLAQHEGRHWGNWSTCYRANADQRNRDTPASQSL